MKTHTVVLLLLMIAGMSFIGSAVPDMITAIIGDGYEIQIAVILFAFGVFLYFPAALRLIYLSHVHEGRLEEAPVKDKTKR
jgi:hypothetical protein